MKEQSLVERTKDLEPEEHISIFNIKNVVEQQKAINLALKMEKDKTNDILNIKVSDKNLTQIQNKKT